MIIKPLILIASHKPVDFYQNNFMQGIMLGKALKQNHNNCYPFADDTGDNISLKNNQYCELTAIYWAWNNLDDSYSHIGLFHYRRFLSFNKFTIFTKYILFLKPLFPFLYNYNISKVSALLSKYDVILPEKINLQFLHKSKTPVTMANNLYLHDDKQDSIKSLILEVIKEHAPKYEEAFIESLTLTDIYFKNMFVMRKDLFNEYSQFLFTVLFNLEEKLVARKHINQNRIYGFLAERLINTFLVHHKHLNSNIRIKSMATIRPLEITFSKAYLKKQYRKLRSRLNITYIKLILKKLF